MDPKEKKQRIELMKDVFTLIHPELLSKKNLYGEKHHEERKHRVQTWLNNILEATSQEAYPWGKEEKRKGILNLLPQFMKLLRECILTHQWTEVLSMLNCISHIPYGADWITWKATLTVMYTEPEDNVNLVQDFFKHAYLLKELNVHDVALEFVQYLISQGLTQKASEVIKTTRKVRKGVLNAQQRGLTQHLMTLLDAYQGLIFYVDWKAALRDNLKSSQITPSQSLYSLTSSQGLNEDAIKRIADKALIALDDLPKKPGVWDIFLTKCVEIHEYYEEFDHAKELLCTYRDKNPDNPNAHRFLYEYLTKNCQHFDEAVVSEESLSCLKGLAKVDPANPLVLTLWQKVTDGGDTDEALPYIFDLLDHDLWQNKEEGWECLATTMGSGLSKDKSLDGKKSFLGALGKCWSTRKDWWPAYHFRASVMASDDHSSDQLLVSKAIVTSVLLGQEHHFNTAARNALNASSCQRLDDALSDLDWDTLNQVGLLDKSSESLNENVHTPYHKKRPYMKLYSTFSSSDSDSDCADTSVSTLSNKIKREKSTEDKLGHLDQSCASSNTSQLASLRSTRRRSLHRSPFHSAKDSAQKSIPVFQNSVLQVLERHSVSSDSLNTSSHSSFTPSNQEVGASSRLSSTQKKSKIDTPSRLFSTPSNPEVDTSSCSSSTRSNSKIDMSSCLSSTPCNPKVGASSRSSSTPHNSEIGTSFRLPSTPSSPEVDTSSHTSPALSNSEANETDRGKKRCKSAVDISEKHCKTTSNTSSPNQTEGKVPDTENSVSKKCQNSNSVSAASEQDLFHDVTIRSFQKPKSKRRIEEVDDVMHGPLKRQKTQK